MNFINIIKKEKKSFFNDYVTFKDFIKYLETHTLLILITIVILFLSHGYLLFNNNIGIDTNIFISEPESNYNWLENGRFGLLIEKKLLNLESFSIFYAELISMIFLILFCLVSYYTFYKLSGKDFNLINLCIPAIGFTHPIWTEQFIFTLQIAEIAFSLFLTILSILFIFKWILEKKFIYTILNILLTTIVLGSYQSFFVIYISLCLFSFILLYENKNFDNKLECIWISITKLLGTFIISFILYQLIIKLLHCDFEYLNNSIAWKSFPKTTCIKNIFNNFKELLLGNGNYYNFGLPLFLGITLLLGIFNSIKNAKSSKVLDKITYFIVYVLFAISPLLLTIYLGQPSALRSQFFIPIIESISMLFVIYYLYNNTYFNFIKYILFIIIFVLLLEQNYTTQKLYYADYLTRQNDIQIAYQLIYDLNKLGINSTDKIYFYGHLEEKVSPSSMIGENIGTSNFEFGYSTEPLYYFSTCNIIRLFKSLGYDFTPISSEQVNEARINTASITSNWPKDNCIKKFDDYYIIKLGDF